MWSTGEGVLETSPTGFNGGSRSPCNLEQNESTGFVLNERCSLPVSFGALSSTRSVDQVAARSLLSIARLKMMRTRHDRAISKWTRGKLRI
jgi:hypothetical protein